MKTHTQKLLTWHLGFSPSHDPCWRTTNTPLAGKGPANEPNWPLAPIELRPAPGEYNGTLGNKRRPSRNVSPGATRSPTRDAGGLFKEVMATPRPHEERPAHLKNSGGWESCKRPHRGRDAQPRGNQSPRTKRGQRAQQFLGAGPLGRSPPSWEPSQGGARLWGPGEICSPDEEKRVKGSPGRGRGQKINSL